MCKNNINRLNWEKLSEFDSSIHYSYEMAFDHFEKIQELRQYGVLRFNVRGETYYKAVCTAIKLLHNINKKKQEITQIKNYIIDTVQDDTLKETVLDTNYDIEYNDEKYEKFFSTEIESFKNLEAKAWQTELDYSYGYCIDCQDVSIFEKVAFAYCVLNCYNKHCDELSSLIEFDNNYDAQQALTVEQC